MDGWMVVMVMLLVVYWGPGGNCECHARQHSSVGVLFNAQYPSPPPSPPLPPPHRQYKAINARVCH